MPTADRANPRRPSRHRQPLRLIGTDSAAEVLEVPARTIRRWAMAQGIGQVVCSRRLLTPRDVEQLRQMRDQLPPQLAGK
jgi:hypothetical protein